MTIKQNTSIGSKDYTSNFDRIFGDREERAKRHAKEKAEMEEKQVAMKKATSAAILGGNFTPFKSPVDGSMVTSYQGLQSHNKKHGVTDMRDYGSEWFERRGQEMHNEKIGNTPEAKRERQQLCGDVLKAYKMIR